MFKKGDFVSIKNSNLKGKILNVKKINIKNDNKNINKNITTHKDNEYTVLINNKKTHILENNLILLDNTKDDFEIKNNMLNNFSNNIKLNYDIDKSNTFIPEIMLRHKNVDEAIYELENFINESIYNKIYTVKIIHGKSGGILRKAVHDYLKSNKNILEFRLGNYFEGSYGVTIAKIKR